jgi:hypothetical protein
MKYFFLTAALFTISSAFASNYGCHLTVLKNNDEYANIETKKDFGFTSGTFFIKEVSRKKNILGKLTRTTEMALIGSLQNGGSIEESFVDAELTIVRSEYGRSDVEILKTPIAKIKGKGTFLVDNESGNYKIRGVCDFTE